MLEYKIEFIEIMPKYFLGHPDGYHQYKISGFKNGERFSVFIFYCPHRTANIIGNNIIGGVYRGHGEIMESDFGMDYATIINKYLRDKMLAEVYSSVDIETKNTQTKRKL